MSIVCGVERYRWRRLNQIERNQDRTMTKDELWIAKWREAIDFMETNHRNPSKHRIEEHRMLNWIKHNRKLMNAGELKSERLEMFRELLAVGERYRRVNQYQ